MTIALITAPALEPLTLGEVKAHLRVDGTHEDTLITDTLRAARQYTEFSSQHRFITQAWRQYEAEAPRDRQVVLRVGPLQQVINVTAFDADGTPHVLDGDDFDIARGEEPAVLTLAPHFDLTLAKNGLEIDLTVGFGDLGTDVPDTLKRATLLLVAHWYEFRGAVPPAQQPVSIPPGFEALMQPYRRVRL